MAQFTGQGPIGLPGGTSNTYTTPFPIRVGTKATDVDGNVYVFCEFAGPVSPGTWVTISNTHTALAIAAADTGRVGVVCGGPGPLGTESTSNLGGWVQIYGLCNFAWTSEVTTQSFDSALNNYLSAGKVVSSPAGSVGIVSLSSIDNTTIFGAWMVANTFNSQVTDASGPTSYVTLITDNAGLGLGVMPTISVFLNFPYVQGTQTGVLSGTSF